jgi:uncharacterized protein involved in response to NO
MFLIGLLGLLALANAVFHAILLGWIDIAFTRPAYAAMIVVVVIEAAIGGRVIPMFTTNATQVKTVTNPRVDKASLVCTAAAGTAWVTGLPGVAVAVLALAAGTTQALRLAGWKPFASLRNPLLWILHASYASIPVGFLLLALAQFGVVPETAAVHVLALGALAGLILGMITRTALGHTGRMLTAGRSETAMYALLQAGVLLRLVAALGSGGVRNATLIGAAACWSTAFALYVIVYGPRLAQARIDGREG